MGCGGDYIGEVPEGTGFQVQERLYTFGSMFNNAVNSRFRSAGGRSYMISM